MEDRKSERVKKSIFLHPEEETWYAVRVYHKREKYAVKQLMRLNVHAWTPTIVKVRKYATKRKKVELPLITQYIFVRMLAKDYTTILSESSVICFLKTDQVVSEVTIEEIDILRRISGKDVNIEVTQVQFEKGDTVEIIAGELTGLTGQLVSYKGKSTVAVMLATLGSQLLLETDVQYIRKTGIHN